MNLAAPEEILEGRRRHERGIFMTGGTGFLGSHLAAGLLRKGHRIFLLARDRNGVAAPERVRRLFDWLGVADPAGQRLHVLTGDLDRPGLGLGRSDLSLVLESAGEIIHCASNTSFADRKRAEIEKANVSNLANVFALAKESRCRFFHHVSTAYVAGKRTGPCHEEPVEVPAFHNVYEETKCRAERSVADFCEKAGLRLNIYRPSIVYGDSRTGKTIRFDALYYPVRTIFFLKRMFERDLREKGGKRAAELGIRIDRAGLVHLPLRIKLLEGTGINLIPVDHFVSAFLHIMEESLEGGIYQIVNPQPKTLEDLARYTEDFLQVRGIDPIPPAAFDGRPRNGLEILFDAYVEAYEPYMNDKRVFLSHRADAILRRRRVSCPAFDYEVFKTCMQYAVDSAWGARLPV